MKIWDFAVILVLLILGGFCIGAGFIPTLEHNINVQHNEPTEATIVGHDIEVTESDDNTEYTPIVTYQYEIDGQTYTNDNTYPGGFSPEKGSRSEAQEFLDEYPVESQTTIYYRPNNPRKSYLTNDGWPGLWFAGAVYIVLLALAGGWFVRRGFRRWRQRTRIKNTPTESVQALSIGPSQIKGTVVTEDRDPLPAPFTEEECVVVKYEVKESTDSSGDNWNTKAIETVFRPFYIDDGTGSVLVEPHDKTTFELDSDGWTETYVDSLSKGPERIKEFVREHPELSFPGDGVGQIKDRKYRQKIIKPGDSVYVFGTVQPREQSGGHAASNEDRLVVKKVEDDEMREPMYLISDDEEQNITGRRELALLRLPVGGLCLAAALVMLYGMFGPMVGLPIPL